MECPRRLFYFVLMSNSQLIEYLSACMTPERWNLFQQIITERTRHLTVVLEDIYQPHNASAVLRSCDCFGVQDVHVIENRNEYEVNPEVSLGASQWLNINRYNEKDEKNSKRCVERLRSAGYQIVATSPHVDGQDTESISLHRPLAILMGTEGRGLSRTLLQEADIQLRIPMYGFTESFYLSVSAAIILNRLTERLRKSNLNWQLSSDEQEEILLQWMRRSIRNSTHIENEFFERLG